MMNSMDNQVHFQGRVGAEVELRHTKSSKAVANLSVAISQDYKDKETGEWVKVEPVWVDVTVWGKLAELCAKQTGKGLLVRIQGRLATQKRKRTIAVGVGKQQQQQEIEYSALYVEASEVRFIQRIDRPEATDQETYGAEPDF
jgi:single stranded DNA-binding protein